MLKNEEHRIKKTIILGTLIPALLYALFVFSVVGVTEAGTSEDALTGLNGALGKTDGVRWRAVWLVCYLDIIHCVRSLFERYVMV